MRRAVYAIHKRQRPEDGAQQYDGDHDELEISREA
jgi:hypothetical protein